MTTSAADNIRVACRHCGMVMTARREHAGRQAKCAKCEQVIRLEEAPALEHPSGLPAPNATPKAAAPTTTSLSCRVCDTRMSFDLKHVGRKAKCPDCGALNVIPPPEAPAKPNTPKALEGAQYDVWHAEDQPWGVDLAERGQNWIRVTCHVCQTLLDATEEQIGKKVACHDCGAETVVERPKETSKKKKIDPATMPAYKVGRPVADAPPEVSSAWLSTVADPEKDNEYVKAPRPELPRWPMFTRVMAFARSQGALGRWLALSAGLTVMSFLLGFALVQFATAASGGTLGAFGYVMMGAAAGMMGAVLGLLTFGAAAAHAISIVVETSEGNDRIQQWPSTNPTDWAGEAGCLLIALPTAGIPGGLLVAALGDALPRGDLPLPLPLIAAFISTVICFPIVLLSQMLASSPWAVFTPEVVLSIPRALSSWLALYVQSVALAAAAVASFGLLSQHLAFLPLTALWLVAIAAVYFRLLGRLAWVIAERG